MQPRWRIAFLVLVLLSGCATAPQPDASPTVRLYQTYGQALDAGAAVYTESMLAAGEAHARGTLTDEQLSTVREVGKQAEMALRLAKAALQAYAASPAQPGDLSTHFAAFQQALTTLTRVLVQEGVTR